MNIKIIISFCSGTIIGGIVTYFAMKKKINEKYEAIADAEIKSVVDFYKNNKSKSTEEKKATIIPTKPDINTFHNIIDDNKYSSGIDLSDKDPYLIEPDDFGDIETYDAISMTYYTDGVLVEDLSQQVVGAEETISVDSLRHFGDPAMGYDEGIIYVRNEKLKIDYEVTMAAGTYADEIKYLNSLHGTED